MSRKTKNNIKSSGLKNRKLLEVKRKGERKNSECNGKQSESKKKDATCKKKQGTTLVSSSWRRQHYRVIVTHVGRNSASITPHCNFSKKRELTSIWFVTIHIPNKYLEDLE